MSIRGLNLLAATLPELANIQSLLNKTPRTRSRIVEVSIVKTALTRQGGIQ
jgi:hypothetical protein